MDNELVMQAKKNVADIVNIALEHRPDRGESALVVYDTEHKLTNILTEAYRTALPKARFVDFATVTKDEIIALFTALSSGDLIVLIQTSNFRLDDFRIRLFLFQKKLKVIEHMHLYRNSPDVWDVYIQSLAYDPAWYRDVGPKLKAHLEHASALRMEAGGTVLTITGGLEMPKLNIGDYTGMENIGGTFPIGEVFTEARNFSDMNGSFLVYAFAGADFNITMHEPFRVDVSQGMVVGYDDRAPQSFINIVSAIKANERPLIREIGFGLNRAITRNRFLQDITAFERILGMHFSMGEKHSVYKKEGISSHKARFHVDLFPVVDRALVDGNVIFENGKYVV